MLIEQIIEFELRGPGVPWPYMYSCNWLISHLFIFFHQAQRLNYAHYASSYTVSKYICTLDTVLDEVMAKD